MLHKPRVSTFPQSLRLNLYIHHNCDFIEREHIENISRMGLDSFLSTYAMVACARARAFNYPILEPGQPQSWKAEKASTEDLFVRNHVSKPKGLGTRIPHKKLVAVGKESS